MWIFVYLFFRSIVHTFIIKQEKFCKKVFNDKKDYSVLQSAIDFIIIVDKSEYDAAERIRIGLRKLKYIHADIDLLVYTKDEIEEWKTHPSTLAYEVLNKGLELYEAA